MADEKTIAFQAFLTEEINEALKRRAKKNGRSIGKEGAMMLTRTLKRGMKDDAAREIG